MVSISSNLIFLGVIMLLFLFVISYRGLNYYPGFYNYSALICSGGKYRYGDEGSDWHDIDCKNTKGEDMSISADYTHGLQITYYFR